MRWIATPRAGCTDEIGMWIPFLSIYGAMTPVYTSGRSLLSPRTNFFESSSGSTNFWAGERSLRPGDVEAQPSATVAEANTPELASMIEHPLVLHLK